MSFAFHSIIHDRNALQRSKDWRSGEGRVLCVASDWVGTTGDGLRFIDQDQVLDADLVYLGQYENQQYFAALYERIPDEFEPQNLRMIADRLSELEASLVVHAVGLSQWHLRHQRCAFCGALTTMTDAGHARKCDECSSAHFPRTDPAVIVLITDDRDRALLGRQPSWPENRYSTLAGFVEPGESIEAAVAREMFEEVGLQLSEMHYVGSQPWPFPSSLMLAFQARATDTALSLDPEEIADARWFTREELAQVTASGEIQIPGPVSISRWLIDQWHGGELKSEWG